MFGCRYACCANEFCSVAPTAVFVTRLRPVQGDIVDVSLSSVGDASTTDSSGSQEEASAFAYLDDGTGLCKIELLDYYVQLKKYNNTPWCAESGMYVLAIAILAVENEFGVDLVPSVTGYVMKDLSAQPDRWAMWQGELIDSHDHTQQDLKTCMAAA